jgi:hypothetical protein
MSYGYKELRAAFRCPELFIKYFLEQSAGWIIDEKPGSLVGRPSPKGWPF